MLYLLRKDDLSGILRVKEGLSMQQTRFQPDLFELRRSKGREQQEMARALGIKKAAMSQIERGRTELTLRRAAQIAAFLEVPLDVVNQAYIETLRRAEVKAALILAHAS